MIRSRISPTVRHGNVIRLRPDHRDTYLRGAAKSLRHIAEWAGWLTELR